MAGAVTQARRLRCTYRYRVLRRGYLARNPLCTSCKRTGRITAARELDHIKPIQWGGDFWEESNWQGLCVECHEAKTAAENSTPVTPEQAAWDDHLEALANG